MQDIFEIENGGITNYYGVAGDPLVLVLHDWYGRLEPLAPLAQAIANQGYYVAVPDFFGGVATLSDASAESLVDQLNADAALAAIVRIVEDARASGSSRVGFLGFSLGGWLALGAAQLGIADAVIAYYSILDDASHGIIPAPVMLHIVEDDPWTPTDETDTFVHRLLDAKTTVVNHIYRDVKHNFANAAITDKVDVSAAQLAYSRSVLFLNDHLKGF